MKKQNCDIFFSLGFESLKTMGKFMPIDIPKEDKMTIKDNKYLENISFFIIQNEFLKY